MERAGRKHWSVGNDHFWLPGDGGILGCAGADDDDRQGRRQRRICRGVCDLVVGLVWSELSETIAEATQNQPTICQRGNWFSVLLVFSKVQLEIFRNHSPTATPSTTSPLRIFDLSTVSTQCPALKMPLHSNADLFCIRRRAAMNEHNQQSNRRAWTRRESRRSVELSQHLLSHSSSFLTTGLTSNERHQPMHTHLHHSTQQTTQRFISPRMMQRMHTKRDRAHKHATVDSSDRNGFGRQMSKRSLMSVTR
ncbi:hypothetical protein BLNAU_17256 [Blattamonas nauphoetae]|uniref:Uncharacterized protein n=1 Tax=Blattamonas nauphoetae TaxID=2049346 RepID=A0ABQ9X7J5_9EUKA|nr:hypothetical protein BLNAU_17256 [Blattamonas nauphoetae]